MMAWTKDEKSRAPLAIYTPGAGDANVCVTRMIYDKSAPLGRRFTVEMSGVSKANETQLEVEVALGLK